MYKQDLALNNLQGLTCHKIYPTDSCLHSIWFLISLNITFYIFINPFIVSPCQLGL